MERSLWIKILIGTLVVLLLTTMVFVFSKILRKNKFLQVNNGNENDIIDVSKNDGIQIFWGNERPIAVMIDNNKKAMPQASLNDAYIVYEIIVEAGESRLMALFKNTDAEVVGPVRSSRHYFLDYALENDAIYVHLGWSPQAQSDISTLGVNNINGQVYDSGKARTDTASFWRDKSRSAPHNAFASIDKIYEISKNRGYLLTSNKPSVLNYVKEEVNLENGEIANEITIPFSTSNIVKFVYDEQTKKYIRYSRGTKQTDYNTGQDVRCKNIIITFAENYTLKDIENKGRQGIKNIGTLDGYYITNGKAIKIKCIKNNRTSQTIYQDLDGNKINVNDGNTFIEICPLDSRVVVK